MSQSVEANEKSIKSAWVSSYPLNANAKGMQALYQKGKKALKPEKIQFIKSMHAKYLETKTLESVAKEYGYTRERVRQYFVIGSKAGIIDYRPFNRENFKKLQKEWSRERILSELLKYGTVRSLCQQHDIPFPLMNRLIKQLGVGIGNQRREYLKKKIYKEYLDLVESLGGKHPSTYDLLFVKNGRNIWARISRTWGSFDVFRQENEIMLPKKKRNYTRKK